MSDDHEPGKLRAEYDFGQMPGGVRGKYAPAYRRGTNLARLDPDIAEAFTTDKSVNEALRSLLRAGGGRPVEPAPATHAPSPRR